MTQQVQTADAETALSPELRKALQGPVQFLKARQRSNGGEFLLSPIVVSRKRLEMAMQVLERQNVYDPDLLVYRTALGMIRSASLNCYIFDAEKNDTIETRMSLLQRQLGIGNACTFQLIEKNVTSLLPKSKEQLKEDAKTSLNDLLRSYRHLDDVLYRAYGGDIFAAEEAVNSLQYTISSTASFQSIIEACLQVEPTKPVAKDLTVG
ncbi:g4886 [Coccomyxa viridis]|uniref:G4886 protein n=1 Tax=Coccomyxa viridis TaxID=1274662 RepID=A0ABP1FYB3_9CHLO